LSAQVRFGDAEEAGVFVVAASDVVRAGLVSLLEADGRFSVTGSAEDLASLAAQESEGPPPDVVVYDAERPEADAPAALRAFVEAAREGERVPAFVVIGGEESAWVREALREGVVRALLPRAASGGEIVAAVEAVSAGLVALDREALAALLSPPAPQAEELLDATRANEHLPPAQNGRNALTPREREVLEMLAEGLSNKEIAWRMSISEHTVKFHVASVFAKLDVSTRTEAVMQGLRRGLLLM
jgi:NarL family two-component system response regulator YdfI